MNKNILITLIVLILFGGGYLLFSLVNSSIENGGNIRAQNNFIESGAEETIEGNSGDSDEPSEEVKTFVITGENYKFLINGEENADIVVQEGDRVHIEFKSTAGFHDWSLDEFDAATQKVSDGETSSVDFIATNTGSFEYYCSVGNHRAQGMKGRFIVE
jgi:plastocyanin